MANKLGSLVVSLGLDASEFTRGLTKEEYRAQQWARNFTTAIDGIRTAAFAQFAAIGGALAALNQQANNVAGFQDLADRIGASAEEVASLKTASDLSGVALETMASASVKLTSALSKADDESKGVGLALKNIGLEIETFAKLSPVEQIDAVAKALAGFEDGAGKTAVAIQLFGKSGADLIPFLNDLAEEGGRQVTLTNEQIKAADEYSKALSRLIGEVDTLAKQTASNAAPALREMVQLLSDVLRYATASGDGMGILGAALGTARTAMEAIIVVGSDVAFVFRTLGDSIGASVAAAQAFLRLDFKGVGAIQKDYAENSAARRRELDAFQFQVLNPNLSKFTPDEARKRGLLGAQVRPSLPVLGSAGGRAGGAKTVDKSLADYQRLLDDYAKAEDENRLKVIRAREKAEIDSAKLVINARRQAVIDEADAVMQANEAYQALVTRLLDATPTRQLEIQRDTMKALADEYERGRFGAVGSAEAMALFGEAANTALGNVPGQLQEANTLAKDLGLSMSSAFEKAVISGGKLSDVLRGLAQDIAQVVLRRTVTEPLGGLLTTAIGSIIPSYDGGGWTGSGARAGGLDGKGGFLAMMHPREMVSDTTRGGMGGTSIVQTFNIGSGADGSTVAQLRAVAGQIKAETLAAVRAQANRGGSFATAVGRA